MTLPPLRPSRSAVAVLALLACPAAAFAADELPDAGFSFSPEDPRAGQEVRFVSSSCDPDGRLVRQAWDLDGDGAFDDALGPAVRLAGRLTPGGARIRVLSVSRAPTCAVVRVSCRGRSCPAKRVSRFVGRGTLRLRTFQRRLRAGTVLTARISKGDSIGKFTQFRIRDGKGPNRRDRCLRPGETVGGACPRSPA